MTKGKVMMPPRMALGKHPAWLDRAEQAFKNERARPLEHNALADPEDPTHWLRIFKLGNAAAQFNGGIKPRKYLNLVERHLAVIEDLGIGLPNREHRIVYGQDDFVRKQRAVLYTRVSTIEGLKLAEIAKTSSGLIALRSMVTSLYFYFSWARDNGRVILGDLLKGSQYTYGRAVNSAVAVPKIMLHDLGQDVLNGNDSRDESWIGYEAKKLDAFAHVVGLVLPSNPLRDWT